MALLTQRLLFIKPSASADEVQMQAAFQSGERRRRRGRTGNSQSMSLGQGKSLLGILYTVVGPGLGRRVAAF